MENNVIPTVESVCKTFTEDQLNLLAVVFQSEGTEIGKLIKAYVLYKVSFSDGE